MPHRPQPNWPTLMRGLLMVLGWLVLAAPLAIAADSPSTSVALLAEPVTPLADLGGSGTEQLVKTTRAVHNTWVLFCSLLVLTMVAPGLAFFYGGLVRRKNVLSVMMQCVFLIALMSVLWAVYGYSLAFGGSGGWIGNGDHLLMRHVQRSWNSEQAMVVTPLIGGIPVLTHMLFQGMCFVLAPVLICGAFAERMKFSAIVVFSILWGTLIYCPLCHWVWDGGPLAYGPDGLLGGSLDFAGGTVVHLSSGFTALVAAMVIGPRMGYRTDPFQPHNLTYTVLGASMLWLGWFGLNAGNHLQADDLTSSIFVATQLSASAGAISWALLEWGLNGKPSVLGACSGAVSGLVAITPAAGFVQPVAALLIGTAAGAGCYFACCVLKHRMGYDDALDAFGLHGVGGLLGALLTGVFATRACSSISQGAPLGLVDGNVSVLVGQTIAVLVTITFVSGGSYLLLKAIDLVIGLRVRGEYEQRGLDVTEHGEEAYRLI